MLKGTIKRLVFGVVVATIAAMAVGFAPQTDTAQPGVHEWTFDGQGMTDQFVVKLPEGHQRIRLSMVLFVQSEGLVFTAADDGQIGLWHIAHELSLGFDGLFWDPDPEAAVSGTVKLIAGVPVLVGPDVAVTEQVFLLDVGDFAGEVIIDVESVITIGGSLGGNGSLQVFGSNASLAIMVTTSP